MMQRSRSTLEVSLQSVQQAWTRVSLWNHSFIMGAGRLIVKWHNPACGVPGREFNWRRDRRFPALNGSVRPNK